jgi:hypothetical protein
MRKQILISLLVVIELTSCASKKSGDGSLTTGKQDTAKVSIARPVPIPFDKDKGFEIVELTFGTTTHSSQTDTTQCKDWRIAVNDVKRIIKDTEVISGADLHHLFDVLSCEATGRVLQEGRSYKLEMNAGSWFVVMSSDTTILLGSFKKAYEQYFLSSVFTGNEESQN